MKSITVYLFLFSLVTFSYSCNEKSSKSDLASTAEKTEKNKVLEESESQLQLNNDKRWLANHETTEGVNNIIGFVSSFSDKNNVEAYHDLNEQLTAEFSMIFKKCTMKGEAHKQLHNFLIPIKDLSEGLNSSDLSICTENYEMLKKHLMDYSDYFE